MEQVLVSESGNIRELVRTAISSQKQQTKTVLSSLLAVQDAVGYISPEAVEEVAEFSGKTVNDVWAVASFYLNFRFTPPCRHVIEVCWGPACHVLGSVHVARELMSRLGMSGEGDDPSGRVSVRFNTCLGACSNGPVISVEHHLMGHMTPEKVAEVLNNLNGAHPRSVHG